MSKGIDYSDIPETDKTFWKNSEIHMPRCKQKVILRLDSEVLKFFQEEGPTPCVAIERPQQ